MRAQRDLEALAGEVAAFLAHASAEQFGAKLSRRLLGFLEAESSRAADLGVDPTPILAVVAGVLWLLGRPGRGVGGWHHGCLPPAPLPRRSAEYHKRRNTAARREPATPAESGQLHP